MSDEPITVERTLRRLGHDDEELGEVRLALALERQHRFQRDIEDLNTRSDLELKARRTLVLPKMLCCAALGWPVAQTRGWVLGALLLGVAALLLFPLLESELVLRTRRRQIDERLREMEKVL